jgi:ABC-2 type transport system ATP-binding protein
MDHESAHLSAVLTASELTRDFGSRRALDGVSFTVAAGELVALIGPNGAGKTTLLSILAGALEPSSGSVARPPGPRSVGWVPQQPALYSKLTVAENLRLFARLEQVSDSDAAVARMLEQTGLGERADDQVGSLSGGNQQRVNIAIGLLSQPTVLLLDEPSSALDPRQRERLWEFIVLLAGHGTSVLYSTHDLLEAQRHSGRVLALDEGRLMFVGVPEQMDWNY